MRIDTTSATIFDRRALRFSTAVYELSAVVSGKNQRVKCNVIPMVSFFAANTLSWTGRDYLLVLHSRHDESAILLRLDTEGPLLRRCGWPVIGPSIRYIAKRKNRACRLKQLVDRHASERGFGGSIRAVKRCVQWTQVGMRLQSKRARSNSLQW